MDRWRIVAHVFVVRIGTLDGLILSGDSATKPDKPECIMKRIKNAKFATYLVLYSAAIIIGLAGFYFGWWALIFGG